MAVVLGRVFQFILFGSPSMPVFVLAFWFEVAK